MHRILRKTQRGFTLIELMIVVAIIGILAAVAIPKFLDYMKKSKRSEAELNLNAINKATDSEYSENSEYPQGDSGGFTPAAACCTVAGKKCAVNENDWKGNAAWDQLGFEMTQPFYFQYSYHPADAQHFQAIAHGDLDCDTIFVDYTLNGDASTGSPTSTLIKPPRAD
ncbi:MAG TPA: type II secretion system protein [Kofleriaceae bacterium]|nr:type II secretion system protein [Kofleriaceae bacterium]